MPTFEELMAGAKPAVRPAAKPTSNVRSFDELMGQAAATPKPTPPPLEEPAFEREAKAQLKKGFFDGAGTALAAGGADVVDFLVTGMFAMPLAAAGDAAVRIAGTLKGDSRDEVGKRAQRSTETIMKSFGQPARDLLRITGLLPEGYETAADKGFGYVMEKVKEAGQAVEQRTGGAVKTEDVQSAVTYAFGAMGVKGVQAAGKGVITAMDAAKAKRVFKELAAENEARQAAELAAQEGQAAAPADPNAPVALHQQTRDANLSAADARVNAEAQAYKLMREGASAKKTDAIVRKNPLVGQALAEISERRSRASAFLEQPDLPPIREDGTFREGALGAILRKPSEMSPAELAARDAAAGIKRGPLGEPVAMSPEQFAKQRGSSMGAADPELLTAMAVGATGLGLAMAFKPDAEEAALAVGAGALMLGRGKLGELTVEKIRNMGDATPLKVLADMDTTTLRTIETLVRQSPGRFEFNIDSIKQRLKQPEVTKAERDVFDRILAAVPEGATTITAKELMEGKKIATGDFELRRQDLSRKAPGHIDSSTADTLTKWGLESIRERYTPATESQRLDGVEVNSLDEVLSEAVKTASTHIWQSPIELGSNNHFGDPNYFGHTRVFEEGGVRHVVELQSDLAQRMGKVLTAEERTALQERSAATQTRLREIEDLKQRANGDLSAAMAEARRLGQDATGEVWASATERRNATFRELEAERRRLQVEYAEAQSKLDEAVSAEKAQPISPMLKDWHKRLIREELADAARAREDALRLAADYERQAQEGLQIMRGERELPPGGQPAPAEAWAKFAQDLRAEADRVRQSASGVVRFADADTVAKVEGWPEQIGEAERLIRNRIRQLEDDLRRATSPNPPALLRNTWGETPEARLQRWEAELEAQKHLLDEAVANKRSYTGPRFSKEHQGIYDRYSRDVTKFLKQLGGTHVVDSAGHGWWEVPVEGSKALPAGKRAQQFGGAHEDLLKSLAAVGGGAGIAWALSDPENKVRNAAWAASLAGLALWARSRTTGLADMAQGTIHTAETFLGNISSEVRDMSKPVLRRLTSHEAAVTKRTYEVMQQIGPFVQKLSKVPADKMAALNAALVTGKSPAILRAMGAAGEPGLIAEWQKVRGTLRELGNGLVETGRLKTLLEDYYPRIVTDYEGLMKALGQEAKSYMDDLLDKANKHALKTTGEGLSPLDMSILVNKHLERAYSGGTGKAGFLRRRSIDEVSQELAKYYAPASESLPLYVQAAVKEIERARFFGKDLVREATTGVVDLDASIGNIVLRESRAGKLSDVQLKRLEALLRSRFGPGERASSRGIQAFRNMGNAMLLGNIFSAGMNIADVGISAAMHDVVPTVVSAMQMLTGKAERITAADMGMAKHIAEEFVHGTRSPVMFKLPGKAQPIQISTAKFVDATFKMTGWRLLDVGAKELAANAAINKYRGLAKTAKGQAEIRRTYADYMGKDTEQLIADLRSGEKTPLVVELAFRELSDSQPISKIEMPKGYNDHPNGRIMYMLKSYSLKQLNLVRDRGIKEIMRGNRRQGLEFLLRYSLLAGTAGMVTQNLIGALLGRDADWSKEAFASNLVKTFGLSSYTLDKLRAGRTNEAVGSVVLPPVQPFAEVLSGKPEAIRYVPIVGRLAYERGLGGAEKANKRLEKEKEKRNE